jgi:adenylate cyclase
MWASGLTVLLVLAAALVIFRTAGGDQRLAGVAAVQSPNAAESRSPAAPASPAVAVSKAIEWGSIAAVVVLPFSPVPPESVPAARLAELVSDDLINTLSRVPGFRVIARSTSIQYAKADVGTLGTDLGVHYAVEGDVRLENGTAYINIALIDVTTRLQVWAERYERAEADRHDVQDDIVKSLARQLHLSVMDVRGREPAAQPGANATLGKAWAALNLFAFFRGGREAGQLFEEVLRTDPNNVSALTGLGTFKAATANIGQTSEDRDLLLGQSENLLRRANALDPNASLPYYFLGLVASRRGQPEDALPLLEKVLELNPSYAPAYAAIGYIQMNTGRPTEAIKNIQYSIQLSPKDNYLGLWSQYLGRIYIELGDDAEAERWLTQSVTLMPNSPLSYLSLAAFLARRGDLEHAHAETVTLAALAPKITLDEWIKVLTVPCKQEEHRPAKLIAGLRQAMMSASAR